MAILAVAVFAIWPFTDDTSARLVSVQTLPEGSVCAWEPDGAGIPADLRVTPDQMVSLARERSQQPRLIAALQQGLGQRNLFAALQRGGRGAAIRIPALVEVARPPLRTLMDTYPAYTAIAVNLQTDEVVLQDNNLWSARIFNRLDDTPAAAALKEPKRILQGPETELQFNNGLYIDPQNGDIYSVESDVGDKMVVFSRDASGNVKPKRKLTTPHRVYNISVNEEKQELYITREYPGEVVVYRKEASETEKPLRMLQGINTGLEAPHGLAVDVKNQFLYVNNWGMSDQVALAGTGRFNPPSIKAYALDANGDTPPVRVIQGDKTQLNWPGAMALDSATGELYVANDVDHSILVFSGIAYINGNVPPTRVIKGDRTRLQNPTGLFLDTMHQELWVSNLGNSSATVYPLKANGDVAPLRTIRSAPRDHRSLIFGRTAAVAYDTNREELLVPN
jgi:6-phosphogluconolactonase (cycloisomerase 2 family)